MEEKVLYVQFNQDFSSLGVGTGHGWSLESVVSVDKLERIHEAPAPEGVRIVERLFSSSLVAIVSSQSPRKLRVCHFKKGNEICNYSYANTILAVRLNRARLVVCLEEMLYIHNIRDMKILHTIRDTPSNPNGILGLSVNADNSYLAYPGSATTGQVQVFDAFNLQAKIVIHAHASPLASLVFNMAGTLLATASEKGTVIRIFSTDDGTRLFEFRRGMRRYASICSIAFSPDNAFLAVSSNTETVHVFLLQQPQDTKEETPTNSWVEWMKASLPSQVTDVWAQGRAYATITTPFHGTQSVVAVTNIQGTDGPKVRVLVASYDGFLYIYGLNTQEGGECPLLKQHRLVEDADSKNKLSANVGSSASYAGVVKGCTPQCMSGVPLIPQQNCNDYPDYNFYKCETPSIKTLQTQMNKISQTSSKQNSYTFFTRMLYDSQKRMLSALPIYDSKKHHDEAGVVPANHSVDCSSISDFNY